MNKTNGASKREGTYIYRDGVQEKRGRMVRVVIADDHPLLRIGIRQILEQNPQITVVGEACNGEEALYLVEQCQPDVLILDLQMPVMDGFEALKVLHETHSELAVLVLSANNDEQLISETLLMGAWSYYLKEEAPERIVGAVHDASAGTGKGSRPMSLAK